MFARKSRGEPRYRRTFAERNLVAIAVIGIIVIGVAFFGTLNLASLPIVGKGPTHEAIFAESGGLHSGDEVRVAGVRVGEVTDIELQGRKVLVKFHAKGVDLPDQTTAAVKVKSMLGQKYLSIDPHGSGTLKGPIPEENTTTPYDVNAAFEDLSTNLGQINTKKMAKSFNALTDAFKDTPASVRKMVHGLTALSRTISSRDQDLNALLGKTAKVSGTLAGRDNELAKLINDGSSLLGELQRRREAVHAMLRGTAALGTQVRGLVTDNRKTLSPALAKLDRVSAILDHNQKNIDKALVRLGPYYRVLASITGNGPWADAYLCGLFDDKGNPVLSTDVIRNCHPGGAR